MACTEVMRAIETSGGGVKSRILLCTCHPRVPVELSLRNERVAERYSAKATPGGSCLWPCKDSTHERMRYKRKEKKDVKIEMKVKENSDKWRGEGEER